MKKSTFLSQLIFSLLFLLALACNTAKEEDQTTTEAPKPNVVVFYVDDLGYGDLSCYGATQVSTPNVDRLAANGIRYTDAHSTAATCTPSRYAMLTGQYAFRKNAQILPGDAPLLIDTARATIADMLRESGYRTGVVGKWHLGLGNGDVNWNEAVKPGPLEIGFDYSFLLPATGDRVPTVYLENRDVVNLDQEDPIAVSYKEKVGNRPTGLERPDLLRQQADKQHSQTIINGISRIGTMGGGESALWVDEEFPDVFTGKAKEFISEASGQPFFLFFSFQDIHVPRLPNERFQGATDMGSRGDAIVQMDWMVGEVMKHLEAQGLADNTLVIFTSDNGPVLDDGYADGAVDQLGDHKPWGPFRGGKYSAFEAGTRVPMITYWPGNIQPGESDALISQVDYYASLAALTKRDLAADEAIDSQNLLNTLTSSDADGRTLMIEEAYTLSLRKNSWKYIAPFEGEELPGWMANKQVESGLSFEPQLYNLSEDLGEQNDVAEQYPELVEELQNQLEVIKQREKRSEAISG